jgi:hypothetical protein
LPGYEGMGEGGLSMRGWIALIGEGDLGMWGWPGYMGWPGYHRMRGGYEGGGPGYH